MSRKKRIGRRVGLLFTWLLGLMAVLVTVAAVGVYKFVNVPSPQSLPQNQLATLTYSNGQTIATVGAENRINVPLSQVPQHVRDAVIAAEDRGFYSEPGVSVRGTLRAVLNDLKGGGSSQGGSTITQQYVKNAYLNSDQTLSRKLKEAAISLKLSREYSKNTILEYYLNTIYFGRGAYGIQAAAKAYFNLDVSKLSVAQGAVLAAVIKSPEYFDPRVTPTAAQGRWNYVVDGMVATKKLTQAERDKLKMPTTIKPARNSTSALDGPMGLVWLQVQKELAANGINAAEINSRGLRIQTTIDQGAQAAAEQAVKDNFSNLSAQQQKEKMRPALTAVNPADGAVLAYYGNSKGSDYDYANGYRPPGSSFKPYTLATALSQNLAGKNPAYAISSTYDGSQCVTIAATNVCNDPSDAPYSSSSVRIDFAMKVSLNTVFDGLANEVGPANVRNTAYAAGIRKTNNDGAPTLVRKDGTTAFGIGIGDADYAVRPLDQSVGFATIANGGIDHPPYFVTKVTDAKGALVYTHKTSGTRAFDPKVANDVGLTLKPIADFSGDALNDGRESGAKTGTAGIESGPNAGKNSDAWMVGYTPQVSAAVWVGSGGTTPISDASGGQEYGRDLPGKTWKEFMDSYLNGKENLPLPTTQMITKGANTPPSYTPTPSSAAPTTTPPTTPAPTTTPPTTRPTTTPPPVTTTTPVAPSPTCGPINVLATCPSSTAPSNGPSASASNGPASKPGGG
jgi:membrane peptidoglycan carboxypeptidase